MLGERIRDIRKRKKMTLEALAGDQLTKGMLSLIENNKANPSMESLRYIAERLGVEVTELLEGVSFQRLREILDVAEKLFNTDSEVVSDKYNQLIILIKPYLENLTQGYESARLLEIYSRSLYQEKRDGWRELSKKAARMYDEMNLVANRASIGIFWAMEKFIEHNYTEALDILLRERKQIEEKHHLIDPMTKVNLDYNEAMLHFAVGDSQTAAVVMEKAIQFSKEHRIFYRIDDLYRLAAAYAWMSGDKEKQEYYLEKLKQYGDFAEDQQSINFYYLFQAMSFNSEEKEYEKALDIIDNYLADVKMDKPFVLLERGKSLYGLGRYHEALACLEKVETPDYAPHPFDLSLLYIHDTYKALCQMELGNRNDALQLALQAVENFEPMPHTSYKNFAIETYNTILGK